MPALARRSAAPDAGSDTATPTVQKQMPAMPPGLSVMQRKAWTRKHAPEPEPEPEPAPCEQQQHFNASSIGDEEDAGSSDTAAALAAPQQLPLVAETSPEGAAARGTRRASRAPRRSPGHSAPPRAGTRGPAGARASGGPIR